VEIGGGGERALMSRCAGGEAGCLATAAYWRKKAGCFALLWLDGSRERCGVQREGCWAGG